MNSSRKRAGLLLSSALLSLLAASTATAAAEDPRDHLPQELLRVFEPLATKSKKFYKAADIGPPVCPSHYQEYDNMAIKPSLTHRGTFYIPHTHIIADNVRCGRTGSRDEFLWLIPSTFLLDSRSADLAGLADVYGVLQKNERFLNASKVVTNKAKKPYFAIDMGDRYCGGKTKMWAKNSLHMLLTTGEFIFNFGSFGWVTRKQSAILSYHPPVGDALSNLCIYKDSTHPGKDGTKLTAGEDAQDDSKLPDNTPIPSPAPFPKGPLATPSPNAFSMMSSPSPSPSPSPGATDAVKVKEEEEEKGCFPASATVEMESGLLKRMDELSVGDSVRVGPHEYSRVFMFTHKLSDGVQREFKEIQVETGDYVRATAGHYILVNNGLKAAKSVKVGDFLTLASGKKSAVTSSSTVFMQGLYNPQTQDSRIIVNGITASTYTSAVHPVAAHGILAPLRFLFRHGLLFEWGILHKRSYGLSVIVPSGTTRC